jgi:hypothetical protein
MTVLENAATAIARWYCEWQAEGLQNVGHGEFRCKAWGWRLTLGTNPGATRTGARPRAGKWSPNSGAGARGLQACEWTRRRCGVLRLALELALVLVVELFGLV